MKLLLVDPNLTQAVTDAVLCAARGAARPGTTLHAVTGDFGPVVIGSRAENALAQHGVLDLVARHASQCDAVVLPVRKENCCSADEPGTIIRLTRCRWVAAGG